jgi:aminoglycoside 3-N-acetyltransferase
MLDLRSITRSFRPLKRRVVNRLWMSIRPEVLRSVLHNVTRGAAEILFVHSSLSSCGYFAAGPEDVLQSLREVSVTLALPTHSYCYPPTSGALAPLFDVRVTPSQNGLLTEIFRAQPGVVRSLHATHSMAATGPLAKELTSHHFQSNTPCGVGTPYHRLVQRHASILLFGVAFHCYTLFHTAEDASGSEYAYENETLDLLRTVDEAGHSRTCLSRRQSRAPRRFEEAGYLLERVGLVCRVSLGRNALLFVRDCASVHEFLVQRLKKTPDFLHRSCASSLD